jgi:hypothetical protein
MNDFGYYLGVFKRIWDIISFPLCLLILAIFVIRYRPETTVYSIAPVVAINKDGSSVLLLNDNSAQSYRDAAIHTAERIANVIYGYESGGKYAAKSAEISQARDYRSVVQKNILESKKSSAVFSMNSEKTIAALDPKNKGIMVVILSGYQTIKTDAGTTSNPVTLNLTMYFNEKRGEDGEIFKISEISFNK